MIPALGLPSIPPPTSWAQVVYLAALMLRRSPFLPGSMEPYLSDKPRAAAALIVAAARASGILMWRLTQARCITMGLRGEGEGGGWEDGRGRRSERGREDGRGESKRRDVREWGRRDWRRERGGRDRQTKNEDSISVTRLLVMVWGSTYHRHAESIWVKVTPKSYSDT